MTHDRLRAAIEHGPVVQRQRPLAYTQVTMVRVHPGSLNCRLEVADFRLQNLQSAIVNLQSEIYLGCWSNPGRRLVCTQEIGVQLPGGPLVLTTGYGLLTPG